MSAIQETIEKRSGKYVGRFLELAGFFQPTTQPTKIDTVEVWGSSPHGPTIFFTRQHLAYPVPMQLFNKAFPYRRRDRQVVQVHFGSSGGDRLF
jgi:hypothetical protein